MRSKEELMAFCEGFVHDIPTEDRVGLDDWVTWGGYYINLFGANLSTNAKTDSDVWVDAYEDKEDMNKLGEPIHAWLIEGESK